MTISTSMAVSCMVALAIGNFAAQLITGKREWQTAFDRSAFQALAVACMVLVSHLGWT
jgi:hypothetical protein